MKEGLNNKDILYNDVVDYFVQAGLDFPKSVAADQGGYFIQV